MWTLTISICSCAVDEGCHELMVTSTWLPGPFQVMLVATYGAIYARNNKFPITRAERGFSRAHLAMCALKRRPCKCS